MTTRKQKRKTFKEQVANSQTGSTNQATQITIEEAITTTTTSSQTQEEVPIPISELNSQNRINKSQSDILIAARKSFHKVMQELLDKATEQNLITNIFSSTQELLSNLFSAHSHISSAGAARINEILVQFNLEASTISFARPDALEPEAQEEESIESAKVSDETIPNIASKQNIESEERVVDPLFQINNLVETYYPNNTQEENAQQVLRFLGNENLNTENIFEPAVAAEITNILETNNFVIVPVNNPTNSSETTILHPVEMTGNPAAANCIIS